MRHPLLLLSLAVLVAPCCNAAPAVAVNPSACPVELTAAQRSGSAAIPVKTPGFAPEPRQSVDLSMRNTRQQRIVAAELEVHGTSARGHFRNAGAALVVGEPAADAVRAVHLVSSVPAEEARTDAVSAGDLTSIGWISVLELRYADGSTWHAGPGHECKVIPDPMLQIAAK